MSRFPGNLNNCALDTLDTSVPTSKAVLSGNVSKEKKKNFKAKMQLLTEGIEQTGPAELHHAPF